MNRLVPFVLSVLLTLSALLAAGIAPRTADAADEAAVFPGEAWETREPAEVGLSREKLDAIRDFVGGRGCVVRHGYLVYAWGDQGQSDDVASAVKPVISTLLLLAVQEGKLKSVDDRVADFEPRLKTLNGGKDAGITWRHLASQTSGYGLAEPPGRAYSYNDYALALYFDVLAQKVYRQGGTEILKTRLADALQFQDRYSLDRGPGRLEISVRDFARFGLLYLRGGKWKDKQVVRPELIRMALGSPIAADVPRTSGQEAEMLPQQRSLGGGKDITPVGPGYYSFNWWLNATDKEGRRLYVDALPDTFVASGHGGRRALWVFPGLDLIVSWNDSPIDDHDTSPGNAKSRCNQAARFVMESVIDRPRTRVTILKDHWRLNGEVTYPGAKAEGRLMNVRMVNAVFEDRGRADFDPEANADRFIAQIPDYAAHGVRAVTLCLQGGMPGYEGAVNSAFEPDGSLRAEYLNRVRRVIETCDRLGVVVILGCYYQRQDQVLRDEAAVRASVVRVARWIKDNAFTNVVLEIANEFPHPGFDHRVLRTAEGQVELIRLAKRTAPDLLVSTSGMGDGRLPDAVAEAADFLLVHFNGVRIEDVPGRIRALRRFGRPIVCNENTRRGEEAARAAELSVESGASYGLVLQESNQTYPFAFRGAADDPAFDTRLARLTRP